MGIIATQDEQNEQGAAGVQGVVKRDLTIFPAPPGTNFTARFAEPHILLPFTCVSNKTKVRGVECALAF